MDQKELEVRKRLRDDFEYYARTCLKIRPEKGDLQSINLSDDSSYSQRFLHEQCESMLKEIGQVRIVVLKARKQYISTYVQCRFFHKSSHERGKNVFILTHKDQSTKALFRMVQRFYDNCPAIVKPSISNSNARELIFDKLDSSYAVSTANSRETGRGETPQYFHWSECAFCANAEEHAKGILQAVPDIPNTEIIIESTANGQVGNGGFFYGLWQQAMRGDNEFKAVFMPWYWKKGNRATAPTGFGFSDEDLAIRDLYKLDNDQLYWRRKKIALLGEKNFKQEYPFVPEEAFQASAEDPLIDPFVIESAQKCKTEPYGPKILGVDPAHMGKDRTSLIRRQGRVAYGLESYRKIDNMAVAGIVHRIIKDEKIDKVFIDASSVGVIDRLRELGYGDIVVAVHFGGAALDSDKYFNKRSEMWHLMKDWLLDQPASIPESKTLASDLSGPQIKSPDSNSRLVLEKKDDMLKRGVISPDEGDALALTFAFPFQGRALDISGFMNPTMRF